MLEQIETMLGSMVRDEWAAEVEAQGEKVLLYRQYADGEHRAKLTPEMKQMLRISGDALDQFNANYCDLVVATMADRLTVERIEGGDDASEWAEALLRYNRFDGFQMDVHEATIRDGDTFVMLGYDNDAQMPTFHHEPAWDGDTGMIVVYDRMRVNILVAIKVWYEANPASSGEDSTDDKRINIYYPDRVEKYWSAEGGDSLDPIGEEPTPWKMTSGEAVGVPVIHFRNRARSRTTTGISELASVIPLQDALNRNLTSMVTTSELSAFQIRVAKGFDPPTNLSPGMWVVIGPEGLDKDQVADADTMEQAQLVPFINQAYFLIDQIGNVSRTPMAGNMGGDSQSGEALKQREVGLLGKIGRFQVKTGNAWEDVMQMAARVQTAFGSKQPPQVQTWNTKWKDAQIRNDAETIQNAMMVADLVGEAETLRLVGKVFGWDEAKIKMIMAEKASETVNRLAGLNLPGFAQFNAPDQQPVNQPDEMTPEDTTIEDAAAA